MSYADRVSSSSKPSCWGSDAFDPHDVECESCRFQHSCRQQSHDAFQTPVNVRRPSSNYAPRRARESNDREVSSSWESGVVDENENPVDRFLKDAAAGALRGMFYEMYSFWKRFRIR